MNTAIKKAIEILLVVSLLSNSSHTYANSDQSSMTFIGKAFIAYTVTMTVVLCSAALIYADDDKYDDFEDDQDHISDELIEIIETNKHDFDQLTSLIIDDTKLHDYLYTESIMRFYESFPLSEDLLQKRQDIHELTYKDEIEAKEKCGHLSNRKSAEKVIFMSSILKKIKSSYIDHKSVNS
ncbi:MAG: hypothetical protein AB8C84_08255 [Oligoflexales bacterium]